MTVNIIFILHPRCGICLFLPQLLAVVHRLVELIHHPLAVLTPAENSTPKLVSRVSFEMFDCLAIMSPPSRLPREQHPRVSCQTPHFWKWEVIGLAPSNPLDDKPIDSVPERITSKARAGLGPRKESAVRTALEKVLFMVLQFVIQIPSAVDKASVSFRLCCGRLCGNLTDSLSNDCKG